MTVDSRTPCATHLSLKSTREIRDVMMKRPPDEVHIRVALCEGMVPGYYQCGAEAPIHHQQERHWRYIGAHPF